MFNLWYIQFMISNNLCAKKRPKNSLCKMTTTCADSLWCYMITHRWEKRLVSSMSLDSSRWQSTTSSFSLSSLMYQCKQCLFSYVFLVFLFHFVFGCMINLQGFPSLHLPQCINVSNVYFSLFFSCFIFLFAYQS